MLRASLKSLLARKLRLLMSAVAVILGVAFVAGSFIFTDTLGRSFDGIMSSSVGDVVVRPAGSGDTLGSTQTIDGALVAKLAAAPGAARADGNIVDYTTFVVGKSGQVDRRPGRAGDGRQLHRRARRQQHLDVLLGLRRRCPPRTARLRSTPRPPKLAAMWSATRSMSSPRRRRPRSTRR
jgi:hypothetical protein